MKFNSTLLALSVSVLLSTGTANATITGTSSVELTVQSTITAGTCTATLTNGAGAEATEISFGDVYKSEIQNKTRVEPFKIKLTNCAGVKTATIAAGPGAGGGCSGRNSDGPSYSAGQVTGFEVWSGAVDTGVLMSCITPPAPQEVNINNGSGEFPMNSRLVVAYLRDASEVGTGAVSAPVTFTVSYQ